MGGTLSVSDDPAVTALLLTRGDFCYHVFLSADKVTPDAVRYGNSLLYVDFSMYLFLGFVFVVRNCVQGIGRSGFVLGAGAAELVALWWASMAISPQHSMSVYS